MKNALSLRLCLVVVTLLCTALPALAATVQQVNITESGKTDVVVRFVANAPLTFQVRKESALRFSIELPGSSINASVSEPSGLLFDRAQKQSSKIQLRFFGAVDYHASVAGKELTIVFTHLGDRDELMNVKALRDALAKGKVNASNTKSIDTSKQKEQLAALEKSLLEKNKAIEEAQSNLKSLAQKTSAAREAQNALNAIEKKKEAEQKALALIVKKKGEAQKSVVEAERKTKALERSLNEYKKTSINLKKENQALVVQNEQVKKEIAANAKKQKIKESLAELTQKRDRVANDITKIGRDIEALRAETKAQKSALAKIKGERKNEALQREKLALEHKGLQAKTLESKRALSAAQSAQKSAEQKAKVAQAEAKKFVAQQRKQNAELNAILARQQEAQKATNLALNKREAARRELESLRKNIVASRKNSRVTPPKASNKILNTEVPNVFGGGTRSVTITKRGRGNTYKRAQRAPAEENGRGNLSTITVQRDGTNGGRVGIRVDGGAQYSVKRATEKQVVLTLYDTRADNLDVRRILDARALGTKVLRVLPRVQEGERQRVELTIELRENTRVRVGHDDAMLWLLVG